MDISLIESGMQDAQRASTELKHMNYDVVITSTLQRSYETAKIVVGDSVRIIKSRLCNERNFGIMEGYTWDDTQHLDPPVLMIKVGNDLHTVNPKGGEPLEDVWQRARRFRNFLLRDYRGKNILVVSHGVFLQMFHGVMRGLTCIESLTVYPSNLELTYFLLSGKQLVDERVIKLTGHVEVWW